MNQRVWKEVEVEFKCPICGEEIHSDIDLEITIGKSGNPIFPKAAEGHTWISVRSSGFYETHYCDPDLLAQVED